VTLVFRRRTGHKYSYLLTYYRSIQRIEFFINPRHKDVVLTRLRLGKCCINAYLHQIGKHPNGLCNSCNKPETITHFLLECPHNETCSAVLAGCNSLGLSPTIDIVLSDSRQYNIITSTLSRKI